MGTEKVASWATASRRPAACRARMRQLWRGGLAMSARVGLMVLTVLVAGAVCAGAETLTVFDAKAPKEDLPPPAGWSADGGATAVVGADGVDAGFPAGRD